jgi:hypothetical protein
VPGATGTGVVKSGATRLRVSALASMIGAKTANNSASAHATPRQTPLKPRLGIQGFSISIAAISCHGGCVTRQIQHGRIGAFHHVRANNLLRHRRWPIMAEQNFLAW